MAFSRLSEKKSEADIQHAKKLLNPYHLSSFIDGFTGDVRIDRVNQIRSLTR